MNSIIIFLHYWNFTALPSYRPQNFSRSSFRSLPKILHCRLLLKFRPYLSSNVAVNSLNSAKDRKLGKLLPYQQLNPIPAYYTEY